MKKVRAFAPASIANFNIGFDIFGIGLSSIGDYVELTQNNVGHHRITAIHSEINLPTAIEKNSCTAAIQAMQKFVGKDVFVDVEITKGFKAGSGLGSSAASSVAAVVAFNELIGNPYSKKELLPFCAEGERIACGSPILDNVSASLLGGAVLLHNRQPLKIPFLKDVYILAFFQQVEIKTQDARDIIPKQVDFPTVIEQTGNLGAFVHALHTNDSELLRKSMQDKLVEPYRKRLIPNFELFQEIAKENNALAFGISGSGPTVFTLVERKEKAKHLAELFEQTRTQKELETLTIIENLNDNHKGAFIC